MAGYIALSESEAELSEQINIYKGVLSGLFVALSGFLETGTPTSFDDPQHRSDSGAAPTEWQIDERFGSAPVDLEHSTYRTSESGTEATSTFLQSDSFDETFLRNLAGTENLRHQYVALEEDLFFTYPGQKWRTLEDGSYEDYYHQTQPWYVSAVTGTKNLLLVVDVSSAAAFQKVAPILDTLSASDYIAVIAFDTHHIVTVSSQQVLTTCSSGCLSRAKATAVASIKAQVEEAFTLAIPANNRTYANASAETSSSLSEAICLGARVLREAAESSQASPSLSTLLLITSQEEVLPDSEALQKTLPSSFRVLTYGITAEESHTLHAWTCLLGGLYRHISELDAPNSIARSYYRFIAEPLNSFENIHSVLSLSWTEDGAGSGGLRPDLFEERTDVMLTLALPVYNPNLSPPKLLGVLGADFAMTTIKDKMDALKQGYSFSMILSAWGDTIYHKEQSIYKQVFPEGIGRDVSRYESFEEFNRTVRPQLLRMQKGDMQIVVDRPIEKGDSKFEGVITRRLETTYFWEKISGLPLVVVYVQAQEDLFKRIYHVPAKEPVDPSDLFWYGYIPKWDEGSNKNVFNTAGEIINQDNCYTYDAEGAVVEGKCWENPTAVDDPSWRDEPDWLLDFHGYLNSLNRQSNIFPYLTDPCHDELAMVSLVQDDLRHDVREHDSIWNYYALKEGITLLYPANDWGAVYDAVRRPWYSRAISNLGKNSLSTPYVDYGGAGLVNSISAAVYRKRVMVNGTEEIDSYVEGVSGYDYVYPEFHSMISDKTAAVA
eukprot:gene6981-8325_t